MKVLATRRYPGPSFDELDDVEVRPLAEFDASEPSLIWTATGRLQAAREVMEGFDGETAEPALSPHASSIWPEHGGTEGLEGRSSEEGRVGCSTPRRPGGQAT